MCGLFGYIGKPLKSVEMLGCIAEHTEFKRGGHAYGWAWLDSENRLRHFKAPGRIMNNREDLEMLKGARAVIGHCRWATHGDVRDNINNHPHATDGGWLVHNGVVSNHRFIANHFNLSLMSECDSEVLARLVEHFTGNYTDRLAEACGYANGNCAVLGLWKDNSIYAARAGNPLSYSLCKGGLYLASLGDSLPGKPVSLDDNKVTVFRGTDGGPTVSGKRKKGSTVRPKALGHRGGLDRVMF